MVKLLWSKEMWTLWTWWTVAAACFALLEFLPLCGWFPCTTHPKKICVISVISG